MSFAARQRELMEGLRWAPARGPKRRAVLAELRNLVTAELRRELNLSRTLASPPQFDRRDHHSDAPPPSDLYGGRTPYWIDQ